jgi:hypothetical protein
MADFDLNPDGPHSPSYTREVGNVLAEAVRVLNYATLGDVPGLDCPADAYTLFGALYTATSRLPQLLGQIADFLDDQLAGGNLADDHQRDPSRLIRSAMTHLQYAQVAAHDVTGRLRAAQADVSGIYLKEDCDG